MKRGAALALVAGIGAAALGVSRAAGPATSEGTPPALPVLGARLSEFPSGDGKPVADKACLQCHSADMPRQQRLTEKQWTAEVEKMIRWGADVPPDRKAELIAYLTAHFGPGNDSFLPVEVAPVSRPAPSR